MKKKNTVSTGIGSIALTAFNRLQDNQHFKLHTNQDDNLSVHFSSYVL